MANGGREVSAFDTDVIEEEDGPGLDKGEADAIGNRDEMQRMLKAGTHSLDHAVIKAELVIGFRDKKQVKKEKKKNKSQTQRTSIYNRLFNRSTETSQVNVASESNSDSSDDAEQSTSNRVQALNNSDEI